MRGVVRRCEDPQMVLRRVLVSRRLAGVDARRVLVVAVEDVDPRFVVIDTARTGHTLLLLDATGSYHRDVERQMGAASSFTPPMMRLRDPEHTKVIVVTLAEATLVLEAEGLAADLRRAGIEPWAWVVNSSLAVAETTDPLLLRRAVREVSQIAKVREDDTDRCVVVPLMAREPVGLAALSELVREPDLVT